MVCVAASKLVVGCLGSSLPFPSSLSRSNYFLDCVLRQEGALLEEPREGEEGEKRGTFWSS